MNEVNAAVVWWKLKHLFEYIQTKRTSVSDYYDAQLKDTVDITQQPQGFKSCHKYVIFHPKRDELKQRLFQEGVETKIHYAKPLGENLPMANKICSQCLSLPIFPELEEKEAEQVTEKVIKIVNEIGLSTSRPVV
jgi:dTDP-4-amino-4,6-dideoxygalactose transaminase